MSLMSMKIRAINPDFKVSYRQVPSIARSLLLSVDLCQYATSSIMTPCVSVGIGAVMF
jgi:hypothetical protein